jgi:uncharacterized protein YndB with AHSA1/START domain
MADDSSTYTVERTTTITAPADRVYAAIVDFHRWTEWSPWEGLDPELRRTYRGPESGIGAVYEWDGNRKAGKGRMEITGADAPHRLAINLDFIKPFKASNKVVFTLVPDGTTTRVVWTLTGKKTLSTRIMGIFTSMDKLVGQDFEKGLAQLKARAEGTPAP